MCAAPARRRAAPALCRAGPVPCRPYMLQRHPYTHRHTHARALRLDSVQVKHSAATVATAPDVPSLLVKSGLSHMSFLSLLTLFPIQWPKVLR